MDANTIDQLLYADFAELFSAKREGREPLTFYEAPNEDAFSDVVKMIDEENKGDPLYFMGVIGGVDMAFNYIANLAPERSFLFDIAEKPVAYLGLKLCLLQESPNFFSYYLNMISIDDEDKKKYWKPKLDLEVLRSALKDEASSNRIVSQGTRFIRSLGYTAVPADVGEVFLDPDFRMKACKGYIKYNQRMLTNGDKDLSWFLPPNYEKLKNIASKNYIRGFKADFFDGFGKSARKLIDAYNIRNLVVYLSNVPEIANRRIKDDVPGQQKFALRQTKGVLEPLSGRLERLWVVDSLHNKNRIVGGKGIDTSGIQ